MKLFVTLFIFLIGVQTVSACGESLNFNIHTGVSPLVRSTIALLIIFTELLLLFKFIQWLFYKKNIEQTKRTARKLIYGLFLLISTILLFFTIKDIVGFLYITNCLPLDTPTATITIPEINFGTTTIKGKN